MEEQEDILAQVGIGAMIVFIGMIIATVTSASVMIHQLEVISERTESVVATASKEVLPVRLRIGSANQGVVAIFSIKMMFTPVVIALVF